jgi:hypothetical protein
MGISGSQPAYSYAQGGVMRGSSSRGNVSSPQVFLTIAGVHYATGHTGAAQVENETLTITETDGDTPNTCSFEMRGIVPSNGQDVVLTVGSKNNLDRLFAGRVMTDASGYVGTPANSREAVSVTDYSWDLMRGTITRRWTTTSATQIAIDILTAAGRGFTSRRVEAGLPVLDEFTVTDQTHLSALKTLADRIGARLKPTYNKDLKFRITSDPNETDPTTLTAASAQLTGTTLVRVTRDLSQVITRQPVEGGGSTALAAVVPGETILPVEDPAWYNAGGGAVTSGPQHLTYTGLQTGGVGAIVGPGALPSVAPSVTLAIGSGPSVGVYQYAYTHNTASGESLPSPLATITTRTFAAPSAAPTLADDNTTGSGNASPGDTVQYTYSYSQAATVGDFTLESTQSPATTAHTLVGPGAGGGAVKAVDVTVQNSTDAAVKWIHVWRKLSSGPSAGTYVWTSFVIINNPAGGTQFIVDGFVPSSIVTPPTGGDLAQVVVASVGLGPSPTISRNVYRTAVNGSQLKLLPTSTTFANNTVTGPFTDNVADGSLGANAPTSDISGLTQPSGQVNAGSTTIILPAPAAFSATGGWAISGQQAIRYSGVSGNTLTGIPATGPGAIATTLIYGSQITAAPALTGIPASGAGAVLYPIKQGDPVNLRVVVDDLPAQAVIAAQIGGGDDGVIEGPLIQDGRISETEARARGLAQLALRKNIDVAVAVTTHDRNVRASRTFGVNLSRPAVVGSFTLSSVTISTFHPSRWPTRSATAGQQFTLEDLLRKAREASR